MPLPYIPNQASEIYKKAYADLIDEDNRLKQKVNTIQQKQLQLWGAENMTPIDNQIAQANLKTFDENYDILIKKLQQYSTQIYNFVLDLKKKENENVKGHMEAPPVKLFETGEILQSYNILMRILNDKTINKPTREIAITNIMKLLPEIDEIIERVYNILVSELNSILYLSEDIGEDLIGLKPGEQRAEKRARATITNSRTYLTSIPKLISTYALWLLMYDNIEKRQFRPIDNIMMREAYNKVLEKDFIRQFIQEENITNEKFANNLVNALYGKENRTFSQNIDEMIIDRYGENISKNMLEKYRNMFINQGNLRFNPTLDEKTKKVIDAFSKTNLIEGLDQVDIGTQIKPMDFPEDIEGIEGDDDDDDEDEDEDEDDDGDGPNPPDDDIEIIDDDEQEKQDDAKMIAEENAEKKAVAKLKKINEDAQQNIEKYTKELNAKKTSENRKVVLRDMIKGLNDSIQKNVERIAKLTGAGKKPRGRPKKQPIAQPIEQPKPQVRKFIRVKAKAPIFDDAGNNFIN